MNSKLDQFGRITIPKKIREKYNLEAGDIVFYDIMKVVSPDGREK